MLADKARLGLSFLGFGCLIAPATMMFIHYLVEGPGTIMYRNNLHGEWLPELALFAFGIMFGFYLMWSWAGWRGRK